MRRLVAVSALLGLALGLVSLTGPSAVANHGAGSFYSNHWWHTGERTVVWHFDSDYPTGSRRDRVKDGAQRWNGQDQSMSFSFNSNDTSGLTYSGCASQLNKSTVFWLSIADPPGEAILGSVSVCVISGEPTRMAQFKMRFDSGNSWYSGTATDPPTNTEIDLWSVATHEMGHATGWTGHFGAAVCPGNTTNQTMCASLPADSTYARSLESHDSSVFADRY